MKTSTYLAMLIGWVIGGIICCLMFEHDFAVTVGGAAGMTMLYIRSKLE